MTQAAGVGAARPMRPELAFDAYTQGFESGATPLLGHLVFYSVFDGEVTPDDLVSWFSDLGLDPDLLPPPLRAVDAFEKVTGRDGARVVYSVDDPGAELRGRRRSKRNEATGRIATLMVRHVRRDGGQIVRHVVREVRDEGQTRLSYDTRLGECRFVRDNSGSEEAGAGQLEIEPDYGAIGRLPELEQARVVSLLDQIRDGYAHRCTYLSGDKLRGLVRSYVERLGGIKVRRTGGMYFVHRQHAGVVAALRELVSEFGEGSEFHRVPLPDQDEMRELVINAITTQAKEDLERLARQIAEAQRVGASETVVQALYDRFRELRAATGEHAQLLSTSLDETDAALKLVQLQLAGLVGSAGDEE